MRTKKAKDLAVGDVIRLKLGEPGNDTATVYRVTEDMVLLARPYISIPTDGVWLVWVEDFPVYRESTVEFEFLRGDRRS